MKSLRWLLLSVFSWAFAVTYAQEDSVNLHLKEVTAGRVWVLEVAFDNANSGNYTAFQMDLNLPEGFEWDETSFSSEMRMAGHTCNASLMDNGVLRVIAYSANNMEIPGNTGNLFHISLRANGEVADGQYQVAANNIRFAKRDGVEYRLSDAYATFSYKKPVVLKNYTIVYMVDNQEYQRQTVLEGQKIPAVVAPTKEGYTFKGWKDLPDVMPSNDITVYASFVPNIYKVVFKVDGETYQTLEVAYGEKITAPAAPVKEGHTFSGWGEIPVTMPAHDVEVTGTFAVNTYKVVFKVDGEVYQTLEVAYGKKITAPAAPVKEGYTFSGWSEIPSTMPAKDIEVTAEFIVNVYTITYILDGKEYGKQEIAYGEKIEPLVVEETQEFVFLGWEELPETMPAHDLTIYGKTELTGIEMLVAESIVDVYTLEGKHIFSGEIWNKVKKLLRRGIYIVNGQRVLVK